LLVLIFRPEDGKNIFLRNIGLSPNCMALQPWWPYFTLEICFPWLRVSRATMLTTLLVVTLRAGQQNVIETDFYSVHIRRFIRPIYSLIVQKTSESINRKFFSKHKWRTTK
jgi:hypothetical protein